MADSEETTPVRTPAKTISVNEVYETEATLFASVCDLAYLQRRQDCGGEMHMQFDVKKDMAARSSSAVHYICGPSCSWRMSASVSRAQSTPGQCTVTLSNDVHSGDCLGSVPQPSRKKQAN